MSQPGLNLASRPFLNRRPVHRFAAVAWTLAGAILMLNVALWLDYRRDSTDLRQRLADVRSRAETVSAEVVDLSKGLDRLGALNEQVEFLNERIAERTFPWSLLFERLGEILPLGVRLQSLNPSVRAGPGGGDPSFDTVLLNINCVAREGQDLYDFVQALYDDIAFERPVLHYETVDDVGAVQFRLDAVYSPHVASSPAAQGVAR
ncbi:MAG: hypothetical protein VYE73_05365 [Acidobacteriota bacterium]|nr:hypothetical protein [Acidobacteriota bacterium]